MNHADVISKRRYTGLNFVARAYSGSHGGIVLRVLDEAVAFAFAP